MSPESKSNRFPEVHDYTEFRKTEVFGTVTRRYTVTLRRPGASAVPRLLHRELPAAGQSRAALRVNVRRAPHCYGWRPSPAWKHSAIDTGLT